MTGCLSATLALVIAAAPATPAPGPTAAPAPSPAAAPAPTPAPAAAPAPAPAPAAAPAPTPAPAAAPAPKPAAAPAPATPAPAPGTSTPAPVMTPKAIRMRQIMKDRALRAEYARASHMGDAGLIVGAVGVGIGLVVGLPAWLLRNDALDDAEAQEYTLDRAAPLALAKRRTQIMTVSFAVAGTITALGTTLAIVGYRRRARLSRGLPATLSLAPSATKTTYGATATIRF